MPPRPRPQTRSMSQIPLNVLRTLPIFSDLEPREITDVIEIAKNVTYQPGTAICTQGAPGDSMLVIELGTARVRINTDTGASMDVAVLGPGQIIGELSLVDTQPRSADVIAETVVRGFLIDRTTFRSLRKKRDPGSMKIMLRIAKTISGRLRHTNAHVSGVIGGVPVELDPTKSGAGGANPKSGWGGFWKGVKSWMGGG